MLPVLLATAALSASPLAAPAPKIVTAEDSGSRVTLVRGQPLRIKLTECGSCGYSWRTLHAPSRKVLRRQKSHTEGHTCQPPCVGGSYTRVFRYVARGTGRTRLRLGYFPPGRDEPQDEFTLRVRVRSPS